MNLLLSLASPLSASAPPGTPSEIPARSNETVRAVKERLAALWRMEAERAALPSAPPAPSEARLLCGGRVLRDGKALEDALGGEAVRAAARAFEARDAAAAPVLHVSIRRPSAPPTPAFSPYGSPFRTPSPSPFRLDGAGSPQMRHRHPAPVPAPAVAPVAAAVPEPVPVPVPEQLLPAAAAAPDPNARLSCAEVLARLVVPSLVLRTCIMMLMLCGSRERNPARFYGVMVMAVLYYLYRVLFVEDGGILVRRGAEEADGEEAEAAAAAAAAAAEDDDQENWEAWDAEEDREREQQQQQQEQQHEQQQQQQHQPQQPQDLAAAAALFQEHWREAEVGVPPRRPARTGLLINAERFVVGLLASLVPSWRPTEVPAN